MNLSYAIAIVVYSPLPFPGGMATSFVDPSGLGQPFIGPPLIGIYRGALLCVRLHIGLQRSAITVMTHSKFYLATIPADQTGNRDAVIIPGTVTPHLVGPAAGWIIRIVMADAFLPCVLIQLIGFCDLIRKRFRGEETAQPTARSNDGD